MRREAANEAFRQLAEALRRSEQKREELEAVLQDFLQGKDPKLANKIAPHWVSARVVSVQTEAEAYLALSWVADIRGQGPIPPAIMDAFQSTGGEVKIATRVQRAIIRVGGQVLSEVEDFTIDDQG